MRDVPMDDLKANLRVKAVYCFVIAPMWHRHGIATKLLERVCSDAEADGFDMIEAYPNVHFIGESADFMGPMVLYQKFGFEICKTLDFKAVMRKSLRSC